MEDKLFIHEDVTDWRDEALKKEMIITDEGDVLRALENGAHTAEVGRAIIVSRLMGQAPEDIIQPNRILITIGAMRGVAQIVRKQKVDVEVENKEVYQAPAYIGKWQRDERAEKDVTEEDTGPSYVKSDDPIALARALHYLDKVIPGHIWNALLIAYSNDGDIVNAADRLKSEIDHMVQMIVK